MLIDFFESLDFFEEVSIKSDKILTSLKPRDLYREVGSKLKLIKHVSMLQIRIADWPM